MFKKDLVFFDFETTGFSAVDNEVTEIGAVVVDGMTLEVKEEYNELVRIIGRVPAKIVELTGITDAMLAKDGISKLQAQKDLQRLMTGRIVIAHNASFDFSFLKWQFDIEPEFFFDTLLLSRMIEPQHKTHKLGVICERIGYDLKNAHRAVHDCHATVAVFKYLMSIDKASRKKYINSLGAKGLKYKPTSTLQLF